MGINFKNFLSSQKNNTKMGDYQSLDHIDGVAISTISANLYNNPRDDLVMFYFRDGANYASVYTQSKLISENLKWNKKIKAKKIFALLVNTRNANALTGPDGYDALRKISLELSSKLTEIQKRDEDAPKQISSKEILFGCTGTIGEKFPLEKIKTSLPALVEKIKYTQNKLIWMKAAMGIITTDLKPKVSMAETKIGSSTIKIYGIAKGSGMIYPNMATTLGYIFTDADLPNDVLKKVEEVIPSDRGELEITSLNQMYLDEKRLEVKVKGRGYSWLDTGTHKSLQEASTFIELIDNRTCSQKTTRVRRKNLLDHSNLYFVYCAMTMIMIYY